MTNQSFSERIRTRFHRWGAPRLTAGPLTRPLRWLSWGAFITTLALTNEAAKGHRLAAVLRLWAWQVWRRFPGRSIEVTFPGGIRLWLPRWSTLAGLVAATGSHEPMEQTFLAHLHREGDGAIDVGANIGIYALSWYGLGVHVVAFEPSTLARKALQYNVSLNQADHAITVLPYALSDAPGRAELTLSLDGANHLIPASSDPEGTEAVDVRRLDDVLADYAAWLSSKKQLVLKIDAEGYDHKVLEGSSGILEQFHPVVVVETWAGGNAVRVLLSRHGYRVYRYDIERRRLVEYPQDWAGQANFLGIADVSLSAVTARLANAPERSLELPVIRWAATDPPFAAAAP